MRREVYVPRLRYRVIDESQYPLKDLASRKSVAAQVFWLEKSREREALRRGSDRLVPLLSDPEDGPLRQAVVTWIDGVLLPRRPRRRKQFPEALGLEEFKTMLENRVAEWNRELREEGRLLGLKEGIKKGVKEGRQKGIQEGRQKGIQEGRQRGVKEGREKGIQEGRQAGEALLLLRLLERKFGRLDAPTRTRVRNADAERLLEWGERVLSAQRLEDVFGS